MRRVLFIVAATAALCGGCVERRMTLVTDPPGARAFYNDREVGLTPVTFNFTYYQPADLRFQKDGYDTLRVVQPVEKPLRARFPLDFFAEALLPWTLRESHTFAFVLEPTVDPPVDQLRERAEEMRAEASDTPGPSDQQGD